MILSQNVTVSQLSLKMSTPISPIFFIPLLSLSTASSFYFNKISSSYSFSPFINGKRFEFLSVKYSKFSYFLSNVLRIDKDEFTYTPEFERMCGTGVVKNQQIQIIGCKYGPTNESSIYSERSNLSVFITDFTNCMSKGNGGGICHVDGYLRTDSNNFINCQANKKGGGFYHSNGAIKVFRSSFNYNTAYEGGSHFCVENHSSNFFMVDFCYFSYIPGPRNDSLIYIRRRPPNENEKIYFRPEHCRFNFTKAELESYINNGVMELVIFDGAPEENKFCPPNAFPGLVYPMRTRMSSTFLPTPQFSETEVFSETSSFTLSDCFTLSLSFAPSSPFTPSNNFSGTRSFTPSNVFSLSSIFTHTTGFTHSHSFTESSHFSGSSRFTPSSGFSPSSFFSSSDVFTKSQSFTASQSGTPSYSPIPTRSPFASKTPTEAFTNSNVFTPSSAFTPSSVFARSGLYSSSDFFNDVPLNRQATKKPLKGDAIMITLIVFGCLLLLLGLIANIILCVQMVQAGEIIITQQM